MRRQLVRGQVCQKWSENPKIQRLGLIRWQIVMQKQNFEVKFINICVMSGNFPQLRTILCT
jgi:hypothetical protein